MTRSLCRRRIPKLPTNYLSKLQNRQKKAGGDHVPLVLRFQKTRPPGVRRSEEYLAKLLSQRSRLMSCEGKPTTAIVRKRDEQYFSDGGEAKNANCRPETHDEPGVIDKPYIANSYKQNKEPEAEGRAEHSEATADVRNVGGQLYQV